MLFLNDVSVEMLLVMAAAAASPHVQSSSQMGQSVSRSSCCCWLANVDDCDGLVVMDELLMVVVVVSSLVVAAVFLEEQAFFFVLDLVPLTPPFILWSASSTQTTTHHMINDMKTIKTRCTHHGSIIGWMLDGILWGWNGWLLHVAVTALLWMCCLGVMILWRGWWWWFLYGHIYGKDIGYEPWSGTCTSISCKFVPSLVLFANQIYLIRPNQSNISIDWTICFHASHLINQ